MREESGLSPEQAVTVLDRLRRAYREWDAARRELLEGLLPLVRDAAPDLWRLWIGLATAIDRLTRNQESDPLKCVVEELERMERDSGARRAATSIPPHRPTARESNAARPHIPRCGGTPATLTTARG